MDQSAKELLEQLRNHPDVATITVMWVEDMGELNEREQMAKGRGQVGRPDTDTYRRDLYRHREGARPLGE